MIHLTHPESDMPMRSDVNRHLCDHWLSLKPDGGLPEWRSFSPADVRKLLPHLIVVECLPDPLRFRFRLIGTFVTGIAGRDATGRMLDEDLYGDRLEAMTWHYRRCAESAEPLATLGTVHFVDRDWMVAEHVFLPFAPPGGPVNIIMAGLDTLDGSAWLSGYSHEIEPVLDWRA
ncbi:MAG: PAS domain-containing protein [Minwuia sp.]|uniref:PAS domain-containing protein n=1 Tax=Minwuia sp. TaxID=2493630 RepID=UPI003A84C36D